LAWGGIAAAALLLWTGWPPKRCSPGPSEERPATEQQKILSAAAVNRLRTVFSAGACQSIYDEASQHFRSQTELDWLYECDRLRANLGSWQRFDVQSITMYGEPRQFVLIDGSAVFAKTRSQLLITWRMEKGGVQLESLSLEENGTVRRIPEQPGLLLDPPPPLGML
jgi:hypothetical protein